MPFTPFPSPLGFGCLAFERDPVGSADAGSAFRALYWSRYRNGIAAVPRPCNLSRLVVGRVGRGVFIITELISNIVVEPWLLW